MTNNTMPNSVLSAQTWVGISPKQARQWFLELEEHPTRYQFSTHEGFAFIKGNFGEIGAEFKTQEYFHGIRITLHFTLTNVNDTDFRFQLLHPPLPVWGTFSINQCDQEERTRLRLDIGSDHKLGRIFLRLPVASQTIQRQIQAEVDHIKDAMESTDYQVL